MSMGYLMRSLKDVEAKSEKKDCFEERILDRNTRLKFLTVERQRRNKARGTVH